jgi:hypothetical protein
LPPKTTDQGDTSVLAAQVEGVHKLMDSRFDAIEKLFDARMDGVERALDHHEKRDEARQAAVTTSQQAILDALLAGNRAAANRGVLPKLPKEVWIGLICLVGVGVLVYGSLHGSSITGSGFGVSVDLGAPGATPPSPHVEVPASTTGP